MTYQPKFPECPYRGQGNSKCSHKFNKDHCICVNKPEKCELYIEWQNKKKSILGASKSKLGVYED